MLSTSPGRDLWSQGSARALGSREPQPQEVYRLIFEVRSGWAWKTWPWKMVGQKKRKEKKIGKKIKEMTED